jgi:hypothetical protein
VSRTRRATSTELFVTFKPPKPLEHMPPGYAWMK